MKLGLAITAAASIWAPIGAAMWVESRSDDLADALGHAAGVDAKIGGVDADLTGTVTFDDVALGELVHADSISGSPSLGSLLDGSFGVDEIRVASPRLAIEVDAGGDSDLARVARKLAGKRADAASSAPAPSSRVRRIVVDGGSLVAHVANVGDIYADDVELVPDDTGVRVVTGRVRVAAGTRGGLTVDLAFARSAAELSLPRGRLGRVLAVGGTGSVALPGASAAAAIPLRDVSAGRLATGGPLELRAALDDGGVPRPLAAELSPDDTGHLIATVHGDRVPLRGLAGVAPRGVDLDGARGTGTLVARHHGAAIRLELAGSVVGARFDHASIAPQPIPLDASVRGAVELSPDAITVDPTSVIVGASQWTVSGWLRRGGIASGALDVALAPAPCNDLLASLPSAVRGPLDGMVMTGTLGGRAHLAIDLSAPVGDGVDLSTDFEGTCTVVTEPPAGDVTTLAGVTEHAYPDGSSARVGRGAPGWIELHRLPGYLPMAFVAAEDAEFWDHHGFDLRQIARSLEIDLRERRLARGGSTISQQLVKNVFLSQRRSADRKLQEAILTWRLEARLDKKTILERYLNVIELGPRVYGIGAASKHWFGLTPMQLSLHQAAFLAALTSEPTSMSRRVRRAGGLDPDSMQRVDVVLRAMNIDGFIDGENMLAARAQPMGFVASALRDD
nr:biosynthetic peptidoglycan transglycosylase [Kofleriaceae bacterium]